MRFRGSTGALDREIAVLETIGRLRLRRYAREMTDLEKDLRALKSERARRRAGLLVTESAPRVAVGDTVEA